MAAITTLVAVAAVGVGVASYSQAKEARAEQKEAMQQQAAVQREMQSEQKAANVSASTTERRNQIREERVRRARVMQAASNTGASGSSGEFGALGGLSTTLSSNIGTNLGRLQTASRLSDLGQTAADFGTQANLASLESQDAMSMFNLSTSIFSAVGGPGMAMKAIKPSTPAPVIK